MNIEKKEEGGNLTLTVSGRIDTITAPELEKEIKDSIDGVSVLDINLKGVEYISSAGLRVLLAAQKIMNNQGKMEISGVQPQVMEIFEVTGFSEILTIKE